MAASKKKPPRPEGRPTLYSPEEHPTAARKLMGEGLTLGELAKAFGIHRSTMDVWRTNHPEFSAMIELGRKEAGENVEKSLYKRAVGYEYEEEKTLVVSGGQGMGSHVERHTVKVHMPGDPVSIKFYLTNRHRDQWSERTKVEGSVRLTLEELLTRASKPKVEATEAPEAEQVDG